MVVSSHSLSTFRREMPSRASSTVTLWPISAISHAARSPIGPPPSTSARTGGLSRPAGPSPALLPRQSDAIRPATLLLRADGAALRLLARSVELRRLDTPPASLPRPKERDARETSSWLWRLARVLRPEGAGALPS